MTLASDYRKLAREQTTLADLQARTSRQIRDRIRRAFADGESWQDIAKATGLSRARIYQLRSS